MSSLENYDMPLTEDDEQLVAIIDGLEAQATALNGPIKSACEHTKICLGGTAASGGLALGEFFTNHPNFVVTSLSVGAACVIGGLAEWAREWRMTNQANHKRRLADSLKQELDPDDQYYLYGHEYNYEPDFEEDSFYED